MTPVKSRILAAETDRAERESNEPKSIPRRSICEVCRDFNVVGFLAQRLWAGRRRSAGRGRTAREDDYDRSRSRW